MCDYAFVLEQHLNTIAVLSLVDLIPLWLSIWYALFTNPMFFEDCPLLYFFVVPNLCKTGAFILSIWRRQAGLHIFGALCSFHIIIGLAYIIGSLYMGPNILCVTSNPLSTLVPLSSSGWLSFFTYVVVKYHTTRNDPFIDSP